MVNRGIGGIDFGKFLYTYGWSIGGFWGTYKNDKGEVRIFDETCHRITKL